jgi:hypothetical protein
LAHTKFGKDLSTSIIVIIIVVVVDVFMIVEVMTVIVINIITDCTIYQQRLAAQFHMISIPLSRGDHRASAS